MLERCYSDKAIIRYPTYINCTVDPEWFSFMSFRSWMKVQDWKNNALDKDIKIKGNQIYSKDTCLFIPQTLNNFLNTQNKQRGQYPIGVSFCKTRKKYIAYISYNGISTNLGGYTSVEEASKVYQEARKLKIQLLITNNTYPVATKYLHQYI